MSVTNRRFLLWLTAAAALLIGTAAGAAVNPNVVGALAAIAQAKVVIEGESLAGEAQTTAGSAGKQDMTPFGQGWSGNAQLFWGAPGPNAELRFQINVPEAKTYAVALFYTQAPDFGMVAIFLDGKRIGSYNGYASSVKVGKSDLRQHALQKGLHNVVLQVFAKDQQSKNYFVGIDKLELTPAAQAPPTRTLSSPSARSKRSGLSPSQRLGRALDQSKEQDPLFGLMMLTIERGLTLPAVQRQTDLDKAFDQALQRHPNVSKELLQQLVNDFKGLSDATRSKAMPKALSGSSPPGSLDPKVISKIVSAIRATGGSTGIAAVAGGKISPSSTGIGGVVSPEVIAAMSNPMIFSIEPQSSSGYDSGQTVTLVGQNFSPNIAENTASIQEELAGGSKGQVASLSPTVGSTSALKIVLPKNLAPGHYFVQVIVTQGGNVRKSNVVDLFIKTPPPPPPTIKSISPDPEYAGKKILIQGTNFKASSPIAGVWFKPMENQPLISYVTLKGEKVAFSVGKVLNNTQMEVTIPPKLMPGRYLVITEIPGAGMTQWVDYNVKAYRYKVNFIKIHCKDESDPEWAGGDEIVTTWVIGADEMAWAKSTGQSSNYEDFDDGDDGWYTASDRSVFMIDGTASQVKKVLVISTSVYEWDAGDVKAANEVIGFVGDLGAIGLAATGNVEAGALVQKLMPYVQKVVAWLGGNPDHLGTRTVAWSSLDLLDNTSNPEGKFTGTLNFDNSDDDGSYSLTYEVLRVE